MKLPLALAFFAALLTAAAAPSGAEDWPQLQRDALRTGNAPEHALDAASLGLVGAVALSDAIQAAPAVADGRVYVVDGAGVAWCLDAETLEVVWRFASRGGPQNCNNVSSPAVAGDTLHFGTMAGIYYVLDRATGELVAEIDCGDPILSAPAAGPDREYVE